MSISLEQQIINTYYSDYQFFFSKPNVCGIAYGYKITNDIITYEPSIHVYVSKKVSLNYLPPNGAIPALYKDIKTDVIETGVFTTGDLSDNPCNSPPTNSSYLNRIRPIQPSYCMSVNYKRQFYNGTGSLGYIVTDNEQVSRTYCLLSANKTFSLFNNAPIGTPILQPAIEFNGKTPKDVVAKLLRFCPLNIVTSSTPPPISEFNTVDGSVASFVQQRIPSLINPFIPPRNFVPTGIATVNLLKPLQFTCCFSGYNRSIVLSTSALIDLFVSPGKNAWFKDIILTNRVDPLVDIRDIGALVCDLDLKAIGIISGSSSIRQGKSYTVICPIKPILENLNVTLVTNENIDFL